MTTFNAIPSEQAGMLFQAMKEDRKVTISLPSGSPMIEVVPQKNIEMATLVFFPEAQNTGQVTLTRHDALAVVCALFEGVKCRINVEDE